MVIRNWINNLRRRAGKPAAESGQSIIILALAFLGLIAMLGLALDLGILYIERIHLKRAIDAATLAGVVELPNEEAAMTRAIEYLRANSYDIGVAADDVSIQVVGCSRSAPNASFSTLLNRTVPITYIGVPHPRATFIIDTYNYQTVTGTNACKWVSSNPSSNIPGTANKLAITGTVMVGMNFMQFFGYSTAPASDVAIAQNVTNLDIAVVFDNSGSMEGDTICYDCWHKTSNDIINYPFPSNGTYNPISYTALFSNSLCGVASTPYITGTNRYIIMEAELYARDYSDWHRAARQTGVGYWALQRGGTDNNRSSSIEGTLTDFNAGGNRSAHMAANPYWTYGQDHPPGPLFGRFYSVQDAEDGLAPRLDYNFTPNWSGTTYVWARVQGGGLYSYDNDFTDHYTRDANKLTWAVDGGTPVQDAQAPTCNAVYDYAGCYLSYVIHDDANCSPGDQNCPGKWAWVRLGSVSVTSGTLHTLNLWAGSPGYEVDKIVLTNDSSPSLGTSTSNDVLTRNNGRGRPATRGSAQGAACDPCNPIYGLAVDSSMCTTPYFRDVVPVGGGTVNLLADDLFGDREPLRTSEDAAKTFVMKLQPQYDQVGFVGFNGTANQQSELACLRRTQIAQGSSLACYSGSSAISYTNVLTTIEHQVARDGTSIAEGMRNGLEVLGANVDGRSGVNNDCNGSIGSACGRPGAKRVMILMTDGSPNAKPGGACDDDQSLWPYNSDPTFDCVMYYAKKARQSNTVIYTIGLGNGVIPELLQAVADETYGTYYFAPNPSKLNDIFDQILSNVYVRLIR
jgi:Flp pilus assembly protein TadG